MGTESPDKRCVRIGTIPFQLPLPAVYKLHDGGTMQAYFIIFFGAGAGGALQHVANMAAVRFLGINFPSSTLIVDVAFLG